MSRIEDNSKLGKFKYLSHFVLHSFLLAIFCFMSVIGLVIFCYFADLFINVKTGNYSSPLFNGYVIVSQSMVPTININDAIVVKRENGDKYRVGDIISFSSSDVNYQGLVITHRIVEKKQETSNHFIYITKGDNNLLVDKVGVETNNIYGKVLFKIPKLGYIQNFLAKPTNFILCILIPAIVIVLYDLYRIFYAISKRNKIN